jgi:hypothetical protein
LNVLFFGWVRPLIPYYFRHGNGFTPKRLSTSRYAAWPLSLHGILPGSIYAMLFMNTQW